MHSAVIIQRRKLPRNPWVQPLKPHSNKYLHLHPHRKQTRSLQLLLRAQLVRVPALLLPAVGRPRRQARVALPADHLVAVVLGGQRLERGLDDAAAEAEDQVEGGLLQTSYR